MILAQLHRYDSITFFQWLLRSLVVLMLLMTSTILKYMANIKAYIFDIIYLNNCKSSNCMCYTFNVSLNVRYQIAVPDRDGRFWQRLQAVLFLACTTRITRVYFCIFCKIFNIYIVSVQKAIGLCLIEISDHMVLGW